MYIIDTSSNSGRYVNLNAKINRNERKKKAPVLLLCMH